MAKEKTVNAPPAKTNGPQQTGALTPLSFSTLANGAPKWLQDKMKNQPAKGLEVADKDDFIYPRLVLTQALTPECIEQKCKPGDIIDNITREVICGQGTPLPFVPVILSKTRLFMVDLDKGGGILCRSNDALVALPGGCGKDQGEEYTADCGKCIHAQWDATNQDDKNEEDNGAPECTLFYNILGFLPTMGNRVTVWSGKATNVKVVKRFLSICKQTGADFWAHKFNLNVIDAQSAQFRYKNWAFEQNGWVTEEEYRVGEKIYKDLSGKTWTPNTNDFEQATPPEPTGGTPPAPF